MGNLRNAEQSEKKGIDLAFTILACVFAGVMAIAACIGSKVINVFGLTASATVLAYPITFLMTDIVSEIWGRKAANRLVLAGFVALVLGYISIQVAIIWPAAPFWQQQPEFQRLFGVSLRIIIGGLLAYLLSQFHDVWAFHFWKKATKGRWLFVRNNLSTLVSQLIDTIVFVVIAFAGIAPLLSMIIGQYVVKVVIALLDTPFAYFFVWLIRRTRPDLVDINLKSSSSD